METIGFVLKKTVSVFCYPLGLALLLLVAGQIFFLRQRRLSARACVAAGTILLLVVSFPITSYLLVSRLEAQAGPYADPAKLKKAGIRYIVVLGAALVTDELSPADRWDLAIFRVLEGVRLCKGIPGSRLVLSGGGVPGKSSQPDAMAVLPMSMGVPRSNLILETRSWDTADEARIFSELVGKEPFALVTSALHMRRALSLFRSRGSHPIPCPCEFHGRDMPSFRSWFLPSAVALRETHAVTHEYLGMLWQDFRSVTRGNNP